MGQHQRHHHRPTPSGCVGHWHLQLPRLSFSLHLDLETVNNCPADCSGHGTCGTDDVCLCEPLWAGDDCSVPIENLADQQYSKTAVAWEWDWYYYDTTLQDGTVPDFQVVVNQTMGGGCDTDLYIKFEDMPMLWDYDYRNALTIQNYALTVGGPMEGRYFIGIYTYSVGDGYEECGYTIRLDQERAGQECESGCSSHGYCSNGICECSGPFAGSNCETMTEDLHEGQSVAGFANNNQWNYYTATANSATNMIISVDQDWNEGGDCDLYIRAGEAPTRFNYDYRNIGFDNSFSIVIQNPLATHWHIGVFGYHHCQYFITETLDASACPNACSGNGQCVSGRCACNDGFAGQNCASPLERIRSKDYLSDSIGQSKWHYYKFTAPSVYTSISVALIEQETSGSLELYVLEGAPPELTGAQYSDTTLSSTHSVYFRYDGTEDNDHDFYIGVYGTSLVPMGSPVPYSVFVYSPPI